MTWDFNLYNRNEDEIYIQIFVRISFAFPFDGLKSYDPNRLNNLLVPNTFF